MSWPGAYRLFWISAFIALVAVGASERSKHQAPSWLDDYGRNSSVNTILSRTLKEADVAPRVEQWLSELPRGRPILMLIAKNQGSAILTADLVSYLAWPRPVVLVSNPEQSLALLRNARERFCAVGFSGLDVPPDVTGKQSFGSALTFIPSTSKTE